MQAVIYKEFGEPSEVLKMETVDSPQPQKGEVLVRMLASPVNPSDLLSIRGGYAIQPELPATPGLEGVGIVESSGGGLLGKYMQGKRVAVLNRERGNWAEMTTLPAKQVIPLPDDLSLEQAAMFFVNPATAFILTRKIHAVPKGAWLLQTAAGSSLGKMVIRLGRKFGFQTINIVRREEQKEELENLGADKVICFEPEKDSTEEFQKKILDITNQKGVQHVIDPVGGKTGSATVTCLGENGKMISFGTLSNEPLIFSPRELMTPGACIQGFWLGQWMQKQSLISKLKLIKQITKLIQEGVLTSVVGESFSLEEINSAVQYAEDSSRKGKAFIVIQEA